MTRKTAFFEGWSWFKFNNLGLTLGMNLKFYTSVTKGLKLKVRKFWRLILTFVKVTREKLVLWRGGLFASPPPPPSHPLHLGLNTNFVKSTLYWLCIYGVKVLLFHLILSNTGFFGLQKYEGEGGLFGLTFPTFFLDQN